MALHTAAEGTTAKERHDAIELAARVGWSLPQGRRVHDKELAGLVTGQIPIEFGVGFRPNAHWLVGGYAQYGAVIVRDCAGDCSGSNVRVGANIHYHFTPDQRVDHWLGIGAGYEWLHLSITEAEVSYRGIEWLNLALGEEFALGESAGIGPIFSATLAQYTYASERAAGLPDERGSIADRGVHLWLSLGVRASYTL